MSEDEALTYSPALFYALGPCLACASYFTFNPVYVPVHDPSVDDPSLPGGPRPLCARCIAIVNENRIKQGQQVWHVHPRAYLPVPFATLLPDAGARQ